MDGNQKRICAYTQGHLGWADLFVELHTGNKNHSGTDDKVWLDIGDRAFVLDNPSHDDREKNNIEGYALNYTRVRKNEIKRIGIRKASDGHAGGWFLDRVKVWLRGELICNNRVDRWLEDDDLWWVSADCGNSDTIVNTLEVKVSTADIKWAGTDDKITLKLGSRSWTLDNQGRNDFERGRTDTFNLDPGVGFYETAINQIRISKASDGSAGGWRIKGLSISVNGNPFYDNQSINRWLKDDQRVWEVFI